MAEELKSLIEKIQEEGVRAAEDRAQKIEKEAAVKAKAIVEKAEKEASLVMSEAKDKVAKMEASSKDLLKQAGRDFLLGLKKEINAMLDSLIVSEVHKALKPEELTKIISRLIKNCEPDERKDITISLGKEDLKKLEQGLLSRFKEEIKKGIMLVPSEDIRGGFIISYDKGKSHYDFTESALAEYIGLYLRPKLAKILEIKAQKGRKS